MDARRPTAEAISGHGTTAMLTVEHTIHPLRDVSGQWCGFVGWGVGGMSVTLVEALNSPVHEGGFGEGTSGKTS